MMSQVIRERPIGRQFYAYIAQRTSVPGSRAARTPAKWAVAFAWA
jgi:hypothetical protein